VEGRLDVQELRDVNIFLNALSFFSIKGSNPEIVASSYRPLYPLD